MWLSGTLAVDFVRVRFSNRSANDVARLRAIFLRIEGNPALLSGGVMIGVESSDETSEEIDAPVDALVRGNAIERAAFDAPFKRRREPK